MSLLRMPLVLLLLTAAPIGPPAAAASPSAERARRDGIRAEAQRHHDRRHQARRAAVRRAAQRPAAPGDSLRVLGWAREGDALWIVAARGGRAFVLACPGPPAP